MPELRRDPILNRYVIIAENRAARPGAEVGWAMTTDAESTAKLVGTAHPTCPFCPGNEHETPDEILALRGDATQQNQPGWRVRVVPNKYPALERDVVPPPHRGTDGPQSLFFQASPAVGAHEVIIDTPRHVTTVGALRDLEFAELLSVVQSRLLALREDPRLKHALVFKNVGRAGGASIEHVHTQLMATDFVPSLVVEELRSARAFFAEHRQCLFCRMIAAEREQGVRVVAESAGYLAICPYASRFAYELWILPKRHASHFESIPAADVSDLASFTRHSIATIEQLSQPTAYNFFLHSNPFDSVAIEHYHWHIEVVPRLTIAAGYEWGSGCAINPVSPEAAAAVLRALLG
jgi:UDPglucose--hexose-1-phosphate uridylyltransferase